MPEVINGRQCTDAELRQMQKNAQAAFDKRVAEMNALLEKERSGQFLSLFEKQIVAAVRREQEEWL